MSGEVIGKIAVNRAIFIKIRDIAAFALAAAVIVGATLFAHATPAGSQAQVEIVFAE